MRNMVAIVLLLLSGSWSALRAESSPVLAQAKQEYDGGNFRAAIEHYQTAIAAGERSAALFYNLGNANYRASEPGAAILNYERALALQPQHPEARANLHLVQDKARALQLRATRWEPYLARTNARALTIAAAVAFWLGIFCVVAWWLARRRAGLRLLGALFAFLAAAGCVAALYSLETGASGRDLAIVTGEKVQARVATADNAGSVLVLPTGSEIKILSTRGEWVYARLPNDLRGWIPAGSAERVRL